MIAQVIRGESMPDLISYLFGPGRDNEHSNQHLVAGYADAVFSAPGRLWQSEPGIQREVRTEARQLGWEVEYPRARWETEVAGGYVWHCSLSIKAEEGQLTDSQWTEAAHAVISALGFSGEDGKAPCRWVAVRHGLSKEGNDHIHIAVNLVREDGTKASAWNDYRKAGAACAGLETRFGLQHVPGRASGRHLSEPSRADREISAARGEPEPLRTRLERKVRACAAAADSEARFIALARQYGLLIRPRYADGSSTEVVGYAVAERDGRRAYSNRTRSRSPVWYGGGKLATDLSLPRLRERWQPDPGVTSMEALAAWSAAGTLTPAGPARAQAKPRRQPAAAGGHAGAAADALAVAATSVEGDVPGPLSQAARSMARAAQDETAPRPPGLAVVIRDMADAFESITLAGTGPAGTLILVREVARLAEAVAVRTATATAQQASVLANASVTALAQAAGQQAAATLTSTREASMSEPTHEEESLRTLTQAGVLAAQVLRARFGGNGTSAGMAAEIARLRAAGYTEQTPYDDLLRELLGEQRWARYVRDDARIAAAAAVTDADRAGIYDMRTLLARAVTRRAWEDDPNPARSVAEILHYRVTTEARRRHPSVMRQAPARPQSRPDFARTDRGDSPAPPPAPPEPMPVTPYDGKLRELLGADRWQWYAGDQRRRDVAKLLSRAAAEGRDMDELLTKAVTMREFEKDARSPARRVASVLHYRIEQILASPPGEARPADLPAGVAGVLSNAAAPASTSPRDQQARPGEDPYASGRPPVFRPSGRPSEGRDSR